MKRLFVTLMTLLVVACGDSGGGGGGGGAVATTPVQGDARCITSSTLCNNGVYGSYSGWMPYSFPYGGTNYNYQTYFQSYGVCGCPLGFAPAYNSVMGMGCYRIQTGFNWNVIYSFTYNYNSGYGAPQSGYNFQQVSGVRNGNGANCTGQVATSCLIDQANSCGAGATCQSIGSSNLGICVNGYNNGWNTGYNPGYGYGYGYNTGYGYSGYPYGAYPYGGGGVGIGFGVGVGIGFGVGAGYRY